MNATDIEDPHLRAALEPDEVVHAYARATDGPSVVSDRRVLLAAASTSR